MNAPIAAALLAARATLPVRPVIAQPTVPADLICLMCNYPHDDLYLDLYGVANEDDGCSVEAVTVAGSPVNVSALIKPEQFKQMSWVVDRATVRAKQQAHAEELADLREWQRSA